MEKVLKKVNIVFCIAIIIALVLNIFMKFRNNSVHTSNNIMNNTQKKIEVIIDPGHGGIDPGAVNKFGEDEAPINLSISNKLLVLLEGSGYIVSMTRYGNDNLYSDTSDTIRGRKNQDINRRIRIINESQADLVISIHLNAFPQGKYYGAQAFYNRNNDIGKEASDIIQNQLKNVLDKDNKRVPQVKKNIRIMDESNKPVVLVECGFVSNPSEGALLSTDSYQEKVAWAIYAGIMEYFNSVGTDVSADEESEI